VRNYIAEEGYDPNLGARPIRRYIQTEIENKISGKIIRGEIVPQGAVRVVLKNKVIELLVEAPVKVG